MDVHENMEKIEISVDKNLIIDLKKHHDIIQCMSPNVLNLFNDEVVEDLQLILGSSTKIINRNAFVANDKKIVSLNKSIVTLRESLFACGGFLKESYQNSLLFLLTSFTVLIENYKKCKELVLVS